MTLHRALVDADPIIIITLSIITPHKLSFMDLPYAVYILKCSNGKHYTGYTTNLKNRLIAHRRGEVSFTKDKLPVELVHLSLFENKQKAYDFERYLKSGSGIAFRNKRLI